VTSDDERVDREGWMVMMSARWRQDFC